MASAGRSSPVRRLPRLFRARAFSGSSSRERSSSEAADSVSPVCVKTCANRRNVAASPGASSHTRRHSAMASVKRPDSMKISARRRCGSAFSGSSWMRALHSCSATALLPLRQLWTASVKLCMDCSDRLIMEDFRPLTMAVPCVQFMTTAQHSLHGLIDFAVAAVSPDPLP